MKKTKTKEYFYSISVQYEKGFLCKFFGLHFTYNLSGIITTNEYRNSEIFKEIKNQVREKIKVKNFAVINYFIAKETL